MTLTNIEKKLIKCFNRPSIRIRIPRLESNKGKFPLIPNWPTAYEPWTIAQILANGHNWGIRTGKQIGNAYLIIIDLDNLWAQQIIKTSSFIQTSKGIHCYVLIKELPKSQHLFNKFGQKIGDLLSLGKQGIGVGSQHWSGIRYSFKQKRHNSTWFVKLENLTELEKFLKDREIFTKKNQLIV
ncbi:MAG: hypothetical protein LBR43_02515 [Spiroplasmataceae bacterium]|nr:hypothetical protein [Spiroplasmataceae bacterium]